MVYATKMHPTAGYREIEHTADWELEVWAPNLPSLLEQAARGMYALSGARLAPEPRQERAFSIQIFDSESLLVEFLSELLYYGETEEIGFDQFQISIKAGALTAQVGGAPLAFLGKEIKAVTYHNLSISQTKDGLKTKIVFDV